MSQYSTDLESIRSLCLQSLPGKYPGGSQEEAKKRLEYELNILVRLGLAELFLKAKEISKFTERKNIICRLVETGCGSLVVYLLGISDVDPLQHKLMFERFCDPQKRWNPELTFVVDPQQAKPLVEFVQECCQHLTIEEELSYQNLRNTKMIPYHILDLACREEKTTDGRLSFRGAIPWELIPPLVASKQIDLNKIPLDDQKTLEVIREGFHLDINPVNHDSEWDLETLQVSSATCIGDIARSLVRLIEIIKRFDAEDFAYTASDFEALQKRFVYQEQIMTMLHEMGGFELGEGVDLIQAITAKEWPIVNAYREWFIKHASPTIKPEVAAALFSQIEVDANYAISKSQAVADAINSYRVVYLSIHYPFEFNETIEALHS